MINDDHGLPTYLHTYIHYLFVKAGYYNWQDYSPAVSCGPASYNTIWIHWIILTSKYKINNEY